jgi:hypothetical protein
MGWMMRTVSFCEEDYKVLPKVNYVKMIVLVYHACGFRFFTLFHARIYAYDVQAYYVGER